MRSRPFRVLSLLAGLALVATAQLSGRQAGADEGTLIVTSRGDTIGREAFTVTRTAAGIRVHTSASYPPRRPAVVLTATVSAGEDLLPDSAAFTTANGAGANVWAVFNPRRITIRRVSPAGESAREFPAPRRPLVADDSLYALYAILPGTEDGPVTLVLPRHAARREAVLTDAGLQATSAGGRQRELRHLILTLGDEVRHIWVDGDRLWKVEIPAAGIVAERLPAARD